MRDQELRRIYKSHAYKQERRQAKADLRAARGRKLRALFNELLGLPNV